MNRTIARLNAVTHDEPDPPDSWSPFLANDPRDDPVNAWIHAQHPGRSVELLVGEDAASYNGVIDALESMPDAKLTDPNAIPWLESQPRVDVDFFGLLYDEHRFSDSAWLARG